ncbi:tenascin-X-like [Anguilla rostrata]|uniref:tenascin-X-like n=1 Tax=Anguilla rostrata TaxID=7938 RepID=UPI0030D33F68
MGPESTTEFTTAPSGSVHLRSRDITDSSVTLFWTQPSVQYSTYHITFTSLRDGGGTIQANVGGRALSFTQTGLAAGQKYKVSIRGERDGKMGPESTTEFTTAPSGSVHLRSRDITDSSVTLFWTQPSVQYSTYHITFTSLRDGGVTVQANVGGRALSFTQTGLAAGQKYKVSIRGETDGKMGPESTTEFMTAPSGSVHLRSRDITDSSVTLFWTQPSVQFSTYHINFTNLRDGGGTIQANVGGRALSFTQTGLAAGQKYKVSIRGERDGKMGPESTTEFTTAPSVSVLLRSRDITDSSVTLFWTQPSVQYSTYHITFKSQRNGDETRTATVGGRLTSFTPTGLAAGQQYKVSIRGERDGKMGPESTTEFTTAPSGSVHLRSRDITNSSVTLFWTQPSVHYSTYHITFTSLRDGGGTIQANIVGRALSFTQTGLAADQKYKVSIRGERDGKMGPESTTEFTTALSGPVHLRSKDITNSSVTLFWTQPSVQYSTYDITFTSLRDGGGTIQANVGGRLSSFTQTGLAAGQKYKVSIRGERDGKMGPESTTEFTTAPSGSVNLRSRDITDSSVYLFWTQPSVQYSTYHITFKSQREEDKMIQVKIGGRLTSFTQTGLAAGQKYKVSIRGERDGKMGPESTTEFTTAPSGSVNLRSRDITDSSVYLFWTQPSVQYSTYHITFKSQREEDEMIQVKIGGRLTSFTQTGLAAGQKYKVSIRGERDGKMGPESTTEFTTAPYGFIYFQTRDTTDSSVTLFWTQPSVQYRTYHITFKSQREGEKIIQAKIEGRLTSFTQTGLAAGQKYKVSIRGERDGKMGPESTTEFTAAPSGSVHLRSRDLTDSSVTLSWTQPSVQYSNYHVTFKSQREGDKMITAKVSGRALSFTQTGLAAGQKYKVSIRGERDGKMGPENNIEFTTAPSGSIYLQTRDATDSSVTLFWTQPSVQYSTYHITFKSQREGDKMIQVEIEGRLTSFTQTGLAASQKYKVSIRGERDGKMGPESTTEFTTATSGTVHLRSRDITDSSVILFWTQPSVLYSTYHITFKSQKVGDKILTTKVGGRLNSFSQTGLAAGQKYKVSIRGERDGKMGPESTTEFTTALSGSVHFRSKDITDSSVTLFWTQPSVQYSTYHITFKSQREREKMITAKVGGRALSFTQTGLAAGQKYKVSIRGERDGKMGPESNIEFTTAPSGSIYLQTRDATNSSVTLFWTQPSVQYSTYHITFKSQREGDKLIQAEIEGRLTSFTQTGLAASQKYKVSIRGERDGKMGPESSTEFTTAPSGSVHLRSRDITDSSVTLFWTQPSVQYSTFHITFTSLRDGGGTIQANVGGRALSFTQTGLAAGQKYKVSIRGERDGKMGPESTTEFTTAPSGSVHLRSRDITDSSVTLFWTQPSVQYSTYHITFTSLRDGGVTVQANVGGRALSFTQTGLAAGQKYKVSIRGERDGKMGPESTTEFMTAPSGSVHLRSRDITDSSVTLFWTQPSVQFSTYHITFTNLRDGGGTIQANVGGRALSFTQTGLAAGQKYKVSIRGERDGKMGPESTTEFTTAPYVSVLLRSRDITDSSVTLFWTQPFVQYSTYHITFKSQRNGDETRTATVGGRLTSFTPTGLAAGQKYKVSIRGERDGKMGPESTTEFTTAPSGSVHLRSRDITNSSVTLFWTQPSVHYSTYHITFTSLVKCLCILCITARF